MSKLIKKLLLILLLSAVTLPAIAENTILVVGDSLSAAYGIQSGQGWVALLTRRLQDNHYGYQVINDSISGDTTSNGLSRLPAALGKYHPVITIIALGGNDGLRGIALPVIEKNLGKMIEASVNAGSKVLLLSVRLPPNYGPAYTAGFEKIFTDLAADHDVTTVMMLRNIDENKKLFQADGIHPKAEAQPLILDNIWPSLEAILRSN